MDHVDVPRITSASFVVNRKQMSSNNSRKKKNGKMMACPYILDTALDELGPDQSVIDFAYISEEKFLLVILLTNNRDLQSLYVIGNEKARTQTINLKALCESDDASPVTVALSPDASTLIIGQANGDMLILPLKLLLDVSWGVSRRSLPQTVMRISLPLDIDPLLMTPTCTKCFWTRNPSRLLVVQTNKAGTIQVVDLDSRKCIAELTAPQSVHSVEIIQTMTTTDLLVTSFTHAQWAIPLENGGRGLSEVLSTCVQSELKKLDQRSVLSGNSSFVSSLSSNDSIVKIYSTIDDVCSYKPLKSFRVPQDTWLTYNTNCVLFVVSNQTELRAAVHFGMGSARLEYALVRGGEGWRPLGFIPLVSSKSSSRVGSLVESLMVTERGLAAIRLDANTCVTRVASEFLFRQPTFSIELLGKVAYAADIPEAALRNSFLSHVLNERKGKSLNSLELSRVLNMANAIKAKPDELLELFTKNENEHQLLPEILRVLETEKRNPLRHRVVELYVKRCAHNTSRDDFARYRSKIDSELSVFLSRYPDVCEGAAQTAAVPLWRSAAILASRDESSRAAVLKHLIFEGARQWADAELSTRAQMMACVNQLDWTCLNEGDVTRLTSLLCIWQRDAFGLLSTSNLCQYALQPVFSGPALHETCLLLAKKYATRFPQACSVLYLVSAVHVLSMSTETKGHSASLRSVGCGLNSTLIVSGDERLVLWGDLSAQQPKQLDTSGIMKTNRRISETETKGTKIRDLPTPRHLEVSGRAHVVRTGTEHVLVLTTTGELYSCGNNRYGQCGVGHAQPVIVPTLLKGDWGKVKSLSAGSYHSGIVCEDGSLWLWGWGLFGQLVNGKYCTDDLHQPTRVDISVKVQSVSCGRVHTVILTDNGEVFVAGGGSYGQMGTDREWRKSHHFHQLIFPDNCKIRLVSTKFYHSVAISEGGRIFEWGRNPQELKMKMFVMRRLRSAQEKTNENDKTDGNNTRSAPPPLPREIPRDDLGLRETQHLVPGKVVDVSTGLSHSAIVTGEGMLFTWGKGLDYQLGHSTKTERCEPHQVFEPVDVKWVQAECGGNHTVAIGEDGRAFAWGRNDTEQCATVPDRPISAPRKYFFKPKDGAAKRCVQLPDDSVFVVKPTMIPDTIVKLPQDELTTDILDQTELLNRLKSSDIATIQMVSKHLSSSGSKGGSMMAPAAALMHLMSGNMSQAVENIVSSSTSDLLGRVESLANLAWDVIANQEEAQSRSILEMAFRDLPMNHHQRQSSQLRALWPNVWNAVGTQRSLTAQEKLSILENWNASVVPAATVEISGSWIKSRSGRARVWAACGHAEPVTVGRATDCSVCAEQWTTKVRASISRV